MTFYPSGANERSARGDLDSCSISANNRFTTNTRSTVLSCIQIPSIRSSACCPTLFITACAIC